MGAGYAATRTGLFSLGAVDGLMVFTQSFAIPCLLFRGVADLDLGAVFDPRLLLSFYAGAIICFALGILGARRIFRRRPGEAVAIGFGALFSNSRAARPADHGRAPTAPTRWRRTSRSSRSTRRFCYLIGITVMEFTRADGRGLADTAARRGPRRCSATR